MDECDVLGARRTRRSVHGLSSFSTSPERVVDTSAFVTSRPANRSRTTTDRSASSNREPLTGTAMPGAAETSVVRNSRGLGRGRRSNASWRGIGEIANRVVGERYDGKDDLYTA